MLEKILEQINSKLNSDFFPKDLSIEDDRLYGVTIILSKQECLFLKNILEDIRNSLD